jgi:hypothetical protein
MPVEMFPEDTKVRENRKGQMKGTTQSSLISHISQKILPQVFLCMCECICMLKEKFDAAVFP